MSEEVSNDIYIARYDMLIKPRAVKIGFVDAVSWNAAIDAAFNLVDRHSYTAAQALLELKK